MPSERIGDAGDEIRGGGAFHRDGLRLGLPHGTRIGQPEAGGIESHPAEEPARIGDVGLRHPATGHGVGESVDPAVRLRLPDDPAVGVVLVPQVDDAARVLEREHASERVVGVPRDAAGGIGHARQPSAGVVFVADRPARVIACLRDAMAAVVGEVDRPLAVRRRDPGEPEEARRVAHERQPVAEAVGDEPDGGLHRGRGAFGIRKAQFGAVLQDHAPAVRPVAPRPPGHLGAEERARRLVMHERAPEWFRSSGSPPVADSDVTAPSTQRSHQIAPTASGPACLDTLSRLPVSRIEDVSRHHFESMPPAPPRQRWPLR